MPRLDDGRRHLRPAGETPIVNMHDYKGWRIGVQAFESDGRWSSRVEVSEPETGPRTHTPSVLVFDGFFAGPEAAEAAAVKSAKQWIDGPGGGAL